MEAVLTVDAQIWLSSARQIVRAKYTRRGLCQFDNHCFHFFTLFALWVNIGGKNSITWFSATSQMTLLVSHESLRANTMGNVPIQESSCIQNYKQLHWFRKKVHKKSCTKTSSGRREATRPVVLRCEGWSRLRAGCGALSPAVELDLVAAAQAQRLHGEPATAADNNYIRRSLQSACSLLWACLLPLLFISQKSCFISLEACIVLTMMICYFFYLLQTSC